MANAGHQEGKRAASPSSSSRSLPLARPSHLSCPTTALERLGSSPARCARAQIDLRRATQCPQTFRHIRHHD
uniref:Uncharacterized protein n=1 Tax=Arundo donax TaxID=35708 RepID=A0A0A8Z719_ARUDO